MIHGMHMVMFTLLIATLISAHIVQAQLSQRRFFPQATYGTPDAEFADEPEEEQSARDPSPSSSQGRLQQDSSFGRLQNQGRLKDTSFNVGKSFPGVVHTVLIPTDDGQGSAVANKATVENNPKSPTAVVTPSFSKQILRNQDHLLNDPDSEVPEFVSVLQVVSPLELLPPKQHVVGRRYPAIDSGPGFIFPPSQVNTFPSVNSNRL